jgi:hypothetical protein
LNCFLNRKFSLPSLSVADCQSQFFKINVAHRVIPWAESTNAICQLGCQDLSRLHKPGELDTPTFGTVKLTRWSVSLIENSLHLLERFQVAKASFQNSISLIGSSSGQNPLMQSVNLFVKPAKLQKPGELDTLAFGTVKLTR